MVKIVPAILPQRFSDIERGVQAIVGSTDTVQVDFVDGEFAPNKTWGFNGKDEEMMNDILKEKRGMPQWEDVDYEFDLMLVHPIEEVEKLLRLGPSRIIFHLESLETDVALKYFQTLPTIINDVVGFGIAIDVATDPSGIEPYAQYIDTIQCMGIDKVGFQGQAFDSKVIEQIKKVKTLFPDKHISVDGGVSLKTAPELIAAGADTLIVGSAIFESEDPRSTLEMFKHS